MRRLLMTGIVAVACNACWAQCGAWEFSPYPGTNDDVNALCVFDADGAGPRPAEVVMGGAFNRIGAPPLVHLASWNDVGEFWTQLLNQAFIDVPTVDRVHAFPGPGGTQVLNVIAGQTVRQVISGVSVERPDVGAGTILAAAGLPNPFGEYDLVVGGTFTFAGGAAVPRLAVWQEYRWWPLGGAPNGAVHALLTVPEGNGVALIAAGEFTQIGNVAANRIAKWNGVQWQPLGTGITGSGAVVKCLAWSLRPGGGADLYVGGTFSLAGGAGAPSVARWDGAAWTPAPAGLTLGTAGTGVINSLATDPLSGRVYAGGTFDRVGGVRANVATWVGDAWQPVGGAMTGEVRAMDFEPTTGNLIVGGTVMAEGRGVVRLVNGAWAALAPGFDQPPRSLAVRRGADGRAELLAGGKFTHVDQATARGVARKVNGRWEELGGGVPSARPITLMTGPDNRVYALGWFTTAGGLPAQDVAVWDGSAWSQVGTGLARYRFFSEPRAMTIAANGDLVIAGGGAASATDATRRGVLRWNGTEWVSLGDSPDATTEYRALAKLANGDLVLGGAFSAIGGVACRNIARWDGSAWHPFGAGANGRVNCVLPLPDGTFVVGGRFTSIGGTEARGAAMWDGSEWRSMGLPLSIADGEVPSLGLWDQDGTGPGAPVIVCGNGPTYWDGASWSPVPGLTLIGPAESIVNGSDGVLSLAGPFTAGGRGQGLVNSVPSTVEILFEQTSAVACRGDWAIFSITPVATGQTDFQLRWEMESPPLSNQWTDEIPNSSAFACALDIEPLRAIHETRYRCIVSVCGVSVTTTPWFLDICDGDADCDQDTDADDVIVFFDAWDRGETTADLNDDGGCDGDDIVRFFAGWDLAC
ncbi:MAG: hypothetical protein ACOYN0_00655 [Phycisphaerales bacterium]